MKNVTYVTYVTPGATIFAFKGPYLRHSNSLFRWYSQLGILTFIVCTFKKSYNLLKLSKCFRDNIGNRLLQGNTVIARGLTYYKSLDSWVWWGLISCMGKFVTPLDSMRRAASLARNCSVISTWWVFFDLWRFCSNVALYDTLFSYVLYLPYLMSL